MNAPRATIVMYHYVRRVSGSAYPRLAALELDAFRGQLDYILAHYSPVTAVDLVEAAAGRLALPARAILLTFDDGYREHYRDVAPLLRSRCVRGVFFPAAFSLLERRVLDVNKIQFLIAATPSAGALVEAIDDRVKQAGGLDGMRSLAEYRRDGWKPVRYDPPDVSYVKHMLQGVLPEPLRTELLDSLFARFVSADERAFADELYFTVDEACEMASMGMSIGAHADRHRTLPSLTRAGQAEEIDGALRVLDAIGVPKAPFLYSYAKGGFNDDTLDLLRQRGCALAVTNRPDIAALSPDTILKLPRLDTNHLPTDTASPPNDWTFRA
jgi:peptidoglycan/xylan/chitin deacetylase (PgdA/CDA1 family)